MKELAHWEDFRVGQTVSFGQMEVTKDQIIGFARQYDPRPFHVDETAAQRTMFGGLVASGWHTCAMLMRMICDGYLLKSASLGSSGVNEVKWLKPVRPGDVLSARYTVKEKRTLDGRPDRGICRLLYELQNQSGETVMILDWPQFFRRRAPDVLSQNRIQQSEGAKDWSRVKRTPGDHMIKFFDKTEIGDEIALGDYEFTADRIKAFAAQYDPQPCHLDEAAARETALGSLRASGWHTAAVSMRRMVHYYLREAGRLKELGRRVPKLGPSPGFKELHWHRAVAAGYVITYRSFAAHKVESSSMPDWGLLITFNDGVNQRGELVFSFVGQVYLERSSPVRGTGSYRSS